MVCKTQRSKSEISDGIKEVSLSKNNIQLNSLNFDKLKVNSITSSLNSTKNSTSSSQANFLAKSKSNKYISTKKIQGLNKSYQVKPCIK